MLSVGQNARRFSPSQNIHVTKSALRRIGNVHYRQQIPTGAPSVNRGGLMAGSSGDCLEADLAENQLTEIEEARAFAQAIIDTVREPVFVLDQDLRVMTARRSFYRTFKVGPKDTEGRLLYELGDGHWDIPKLRLLLEKIVPENGMMEDYEVENEFPNVGPRTMGLNARKVFYEEGSHTTILLGIEDVTRQRVLEREKDDLLRQKDVLLEEIQHRIANSLQIIAGIILMKANTVISEESRLLLQDTHDRVISIATVQQQLNVSGIIGPIEMVPYLTGLSEALAASMIRNARPVALKVVGTAGSL